MKHNLFSELFSRRSSFFEFILTALCFALGINLISDVLPRIFGWDDNISLRFGILICLLAITYLVIRMKGGKKITREFIGFISYNATENKLVKIRGYYFPIKVNMYIDLVIDKLPISKS